jgi:prevent-host-death family protein
MDSISISKFKATCLAVLDRVKRTGRPLLVTRRGEPIAEVIPPRAQTRARRWLGTRQMTGRITGDLIAPATARADWESLSR